MLFIMRILSFIIPEKIVMYLRLSVLKLRVKKTRKENKIIFLLGVPQHGNLGDHAITSAEQDFFKNYFSDFVVIEVPLYTYTNHLYELKSIINNNIICISGGGSLGTLWMEAENDIREIIEVFNNNVVFILPQTIYYEDSEWGKGELGKSKLIYGMNKELTLCAREKASFEFMKKEYVNNSVFLIPDMVLYLKKDHYYKERNGILLCIRKDKESIINDKTKYELYEIAKEHSDKVEFTDTVLPVRIRNKAREKYLNEKFNEFGEAELVITDRLHGMIFAAITGTPCIALNNCSNKVKGVYEWIKHLNYIHYMDETDDIREYIGRLIKLGGCTYNNDVFVQYFKKLSDAINATVTS